jgi:hypothetical protein
LFMLYSQKDERSRKEKEGRRTNLPGLLILGLDLERLARVQVGETDPGVLGEAGRYEPKGGCVGEERRREERGRTGKIASGTVAR